MEKNPVIYREGLKRHCVYCGTRIEWTELNNYVMGDGWSCQSCDPETKQTEE